MLNKKEKDLFIVGSFQTYKFTREEKKYFKKLKKEYKDVIIVLKDSYITKDNPLTVKDRKLLFSKYLKIKNVIAVKKQKHKEHYYNLILNNIGSLNFNKTELLLDDKQDEIAINNHLKSISEKLYVYSNDNIKSFSNKKIKEPKRNVSNYLLGKISSILNLFPVCFSTVDIIVTKEIDDEEHILLGQKKNGVKHDEWVFIGGFVDKGDRSARNAAARELKEESSLEISPKILNIVDNIEIDDWRYKDTEHSIFTTIFTVEISDKWSDYIINNKEQAGDDIVNLKWIKPSEIEQYLSKTHLPVWETYQKYKKTN